MNAKVKYCNINRLFSINYNSEEIHTQPTKPNETEIIEALSSDNWKARFEQMRSGEKVRVSDRIYFEMLGAVPPLKYSLNGFVCGEPFSGNIYYHFTIEDGKRFGQLKGLE